MLTVFIRAVLLYFVAVIGIRAMGKRQVGQLQPFELVVVIMISEIAATPMESADTPFLYGILPVVALIVCHSLLSVLVMWSEKLRAWLCGQPTVLIRGGAICEKQLRRTAITLNDLMEEIRVSGIQDLGQVETAVLETGGTVSVFPKSADRPLTPRDMGISPQAEALPLPLILDGVVQRDNLTRGGFSDSWLHKLVEGFGFDNEKEVLFLSVNSQRQAICQGKGSETMQSRGDV